MTRLCIGFFKNPGVKVHKDWEYLSSLEQIVQLVLINKEGPVSLHENPSEKPNPETAVRTLPHGGASDHESGSEPDAGGSMDIQELGSTDWQQ